MTIGKKPRPRSGMAAAVAATFSNGSVKNSAARAVRMDALGSVVVAMETASAAGLRGMITRRRGIEPGCSRPKGSQSGVILLIWRL